MMICKNIKRGVFPFPGTESVNRPCKIRVKAMDQDGHEFEMEPEGLVYAFSMKSTILTGNYLLITSHP